MKAKNPYISNSELTAFRRNRAFINGDKDDLLQAFNQLIEENLTSSSNHRALFNLWNALSVSEQASNPEQVKRTLAYTLEFSPFLHEIDDYAILIESIITRFIDTSSEITSTAYFILSVLFLNRRNYNRAYNYAKMAHFYALQIEEVANQPYLCNAQLQLVFSQMLLKDFSRVEQYIDQFGWYLENCQNVQEKVLIQTVNLLKNTLLGNVEETELLTYAEKLAYSNKDFYPLYLMMQMKHLVKSPLILDQIAQLHAAVQERTFTISQQALHEYYFLRNRFIPNSNLFFTRAEQLFDKIKLNGSEIHLFHLTNVDLNLPNLFELMSRVPDTDFLLYPLHHNEFIIVFDLQESKHLTQAWEEELKNVKVLVHVQPTAETTRFMDLYIMYAQKMSEMLDF